VDFMAAFPVVGDGPISFFDVVTGQQTLVPLSCVQSPDGTAIELLPPFAAMAHAAAIKALIATLLGSGRLSFGTGPAPALAFVLTAADDGSAGNNVTVDIQYPTTPTLFDVAATESETYDALTVASIKTVLGTPGVAGTRPGLVHVLDGAIAMPVAAAAQPLTGGTPMVAAQFPVPAAAGNAFTVEARRPGADSNVITVAITNVDAGAGTFSLTVKWTKTVTGVDASTIGAKLADLAYLVTVTAPASGPFALPAAAKLSLGGGVDPAAASLNIVAKA
jgi:hypothetical protein